ncbi:restriction endonuclease [Mycobacterium sp. SMC-2]|uniref:restriction endonuclease n=1 Tax=Mycobacterium sp. SMC-2 TaxID=2857058 RepID=UPI0021B37D4B|nr:restriction endonuclease [Mycobacterium sp. SMC-2]
MLTALVVIPLACGLFAGVAERSLGAGFVAFYLVLLAEVLIGWATRRQWPRGGRADATMRAIDAMDGVAFEGYVAARLRRAGWRVKFTPPVGDYGVDLIAEKGGHSVAVQCKRYGKSVGVAAVQQVVSGARHHGCTRSIVVSNREFTRAAKQLANTHGCQLIGRRVLQAWVPPPAASVENPAGRKAARPVSEQKIGPAPVPPPRRCGRPDSQNF